MSIFQQLYKSLYSPKDMARYRFQKIGKSILYIFLLSLLALIPEMVQLTSLVRTELSLAERTVQSEIPEFTIEQGELKADIQESILKEENDFVFLFDPNSEELPSSLTHRDGLFFLKHKAILVSDTTNETYAYSLLNDTIISKADIEDFLSTIKSIYPIALVILGVLLYLFDSFIVLFGVTAIAFVGRLFAAQMRRKVHYKQAWTLTAYSFTIPVIFFMVMKFLSITVLHSFLIFIAVSCFVLFLTLKEIPPIQEKKNL